MTKAEMTAEILSARKARAVTWATMANAVGRSEVHVTSARLGENTVNGDEAGRLQTLLKLTPTATTAPVGFSDRGEAAPTIPTEPLAYRFQEIIYVHGRTMKELIEEKFGPGIMRAIDFTMDIERIADPKGDRVELTMIGKLLGYNN